MNLVELGRDQIVFARNYTLRLLETIDYSLWFRMPTEGVTHIAWQVGHLAMAEYRLILERIRGRKPEDEQLISTEFLKKFGRDSVPDPNPKNYPPASEIRALADRVHERVLHELKAISADDLPQPPLTPHSLCKTKKDVLFWCSAHEMFHAGQIALLRRLLGHPPVW